MQILEEADMRQKFEVICVLFVLLLFCFPSMAQEQEPDDPALHQQQPYQEDEPEYLIFVKFGDIVGESMDKDHKDWCEAIDYQHSQYFTADSQENKQKHDVELQPFIVRKHIDKATPKLNEAMFKGTLLATVTIQLVRTGKINQPFMEYQLKNARIISVSVSGSASIGQFLPVEEVHLIYREIKWSYTETDLMGKTKGKTEAAWKVEQK
jgi:type VI secretion system Hcp family effector